MKTTDWNLAPIWVQALETPDARVYEARDYLWASELGKPFIDNWLKMRGTPASNPPNGRSLRKFEAGNLMEWVVKIILMRSGILESTQERAEFQYPGLLRVSGKMDFVAGGMPDWEQAHTALQTLELPPKLMFAAEKVIANLNERYPDGLGLKPLELKSVSAYMFDALERTGRALRIHRMQLYLYLKAHQYERGDIIYLCRDDMRMMEIPVFLNDVVTEQEFKDYIFEMTEWYNNGVRPPLENPVAFDYDMMKMSKNNQVAWSPYLTMLYGLKDQAEFDDTYKSTAERWNRVLGRMAKGAKMTEKNLEAIKEMTEAGFNPESLADLYKKYDVPEEGEEQVGESGA